MMGRLRIGLTVALMAMAAPAFASGAPAVGEAASAALSANQYIWRDDPASLDPVSVVVSVSEQRAYVYRGDQVVAVSTVSTGKDGKDTPLGTYAILQKKEEHRSNLYNDASMPFMQRLTWDGIAIHAGRNPGFPDSHGCIRVPAAFARKLFAITTVGTPVEVTEGGADGPVAAPPPETSAETARANAFQLNSLEP